MDEEGQCGIGLYAYATELADHLQSNTQVVEGTNKVVTGECKKAQMIKKPQVAARTTIKKKLFEHSKDDKHKIREAQENLPALTDYVLDSMRTDHYKDMLNWLARFEVKRFPPIQDRAPQMQAPDDSADSEFHRPIVRDGIDHIGNDDLLWAAPWNMWWWRAWMKVCPKPVLCNFALIMHKHNKLTDATSAWLCPDTYYYDGFFVEAKLTHASASSHSVEIKTPLRILNSRRFFAGLRCKVSPVALVASAWGLRWDTPENAQLVGTRKQLFRLEEQHPKELKAYIKKITAKSEVAAAAAAAAADAGGDVAGLAVAVGAAEAVAADPAPAAAGAVDAAPIDVAALDALLAAHAAVPDGEMPPDDADDAHLGGFLADLHSVIELAAADGAHDAPKGQTLRIRIHFRVLNNL